MFGRAHCCLVELPAACPSYILVIWWCYSAVWWSSLGGAYWLLFGGATVLFGGAHLAEPYVDGGGVWCLTELLGGAHYGLAEPHVDGVMLLHINLVEPYVDGGGM